MNNQGILAWDADIVGWDTITVDVDIEVDIDINNSGYIDPMDPGAYTTQLVMSSTFSHSYVFTRELWTPDADATDNKWQHIGGYWRVGQPFADTPPFFRGVYTTPIQNQWLRQDEIYPNPTGNSASLSFVDRTQAWNMSWAANHTEVYNDIFNLFDPPANQSGTENGYLKLELVLSVDYADRIPSWYPQVSWVDANGDPLGPDTTFPDPDTQTFAWPFGSYPGIVSLICPDNGLTLPGNIEGPEIVPIHWRTAGGDLLDFGGTGTTTISSITHDIPGNEGLWGKWFDGTYKRELTVTITCS